MTCFNIKFYYDDLNYPDALIMLTFILYFTLFKYFYT